MKKQYEEPDEMIDHNGNLDTVSGLMSIFFAYNQKEADEGTTWATWPDWELCLTSMKETFISRMTRIQMPLKLKGSNGLPSSN